ncbi:MAG: hypothetical protein EA359_19205 [Balneolaceae bacterium]|nr:MAG: hypothetical protein EA359_19205 [Balneolaceae bacterium]
MIPGSDTAKQDLIILVAGAVSLLMFFWLYSGYHPLSYADHSYGKAASAQTASEITGEMGFSYSDGPVTTFRANSTLLDSLQKNGSFPEFYGNPLHRALYPVFYWENRFRVDQPGEETFSGFFELPSNIIQVRLSEEGKFIALQNNQNILPVRRLNQDALARAYQVESFHFIDPEDSEAHNLLAFQFPGVSDPVADSLAFSQRRIQYLGRDAARRMATFHLEKSAWPAHHFEVKSTDLYPLETGEAARVVFEHKGDFSTQVTEVSVAVLPTGALLKMEYSFPNNQVTGASFSQIISNVRGVIILFAVLWIIVLLFIRFRMRLIDIQAATLVAVLAGLLVPFLIILGQAYNHINGFGSFNFSFILTLLITIGFFAGVVSVGYFAVTAISDSITRQYWKDKIRTVDLLRVGQFFNIPIGINFVRGISYGFILLVFWMITLFVIPGSYVSLDGNVFNANTTYLPFIAELVGNLVLYLLLAQVFFLILMGQVRASTKNPVILVATPAILFGMMYPFPFGIGDFAAELLSASVVGLALGWIYYREDFLTTLISLIIFITSVSTAPGWLVDASPDALTFFIFMGLVIVGYIIGGYNIYRGKQVRELPDFVPEYVMELAREDRMKQELQIARKVQESFLPVKTPDIPGLDIAAICKPAYETGGDYYDLISLRDGRLAVTIGDVSGKGIQAAFYMTFIKGVLHSLCNDYTSTIDVLTKTNKIFRQNANKGTFISLIFGVVNVPDNTFLFSRAGHNPLLFYKSKTKTLHEFKPEGLAIGMAEEDVFKKYIGEQRVPFNKDDMLIFFTDGVVEAISKTNKVYGDQRLHELIKKYHNLPSNELVNKLENDLARFSKQTLQHDDLTMIVIKKR